MGRGGQITMASARRHRASRVSTESPEWLENLALDGCVIVDPFLPWSRLGPLREACDALLAIAARGKPGAGVRAILGAAPLLHRLAMGPEIEALIRPVLGPGLAVVRGVLFDKRPDSNWAVAWHQDVTIAVSAKRETPGFTAWSRKGGIWHVHPPAGILEQMVTIRLHVDDCPSDNGALRVLPGTHRGGKSGGSPPAGVAPRVCEVRAGGALIMRPLLWHSSPKARAPGRRRVLHFEYAAGPLPGGLHWHPAA